MGQIEALRKLADKVDAGDVVTAHYARKAFPNRHYHAVTADEGSLDAAHSLHKAVLGDKWHVEDLSQAAIHVGAPWGCILKKCNVSMPDVEVSSGYDFANNPARAWLLAIIKAKIQELEND